jgi:putative aldouronate transport system substrate-binding protein
MKKVVLGVFFLILAGVPVFAAGGQASSRPAGGSGPVEITVEVFDRGTDGGRSDPTDNNYTRWIREKLLKDENIKVTFSAIPRNAETVTLNNLMAAGNAPDICFTYDQTLIANYRNQGGLYDMAPAAERLMPDLKKFLGPDPSIPGRDLIYRTLSNGKMYSIPSRRMVTALFNTFIRKDWLDKLGLPLPKTREEFYNALVAFRDRDPGGVGKDRVIPLTFSGSINNINSINSFLDPSVTVKDLWINYTMQDTYTGWVALPGIKDGFRWFNKLYNEGLLDRDFPLRVGADVDNLHKSGVTGSFESNWAYPFQDTPGIYRDLAANVPGAEFVAVDCFPNAKGITSKVVYDVEGIHFFIPVFSKAPEGAMRYVNWLSRIENITFLQLGPEGIAHDMVDSLPQMKPAAGLWVQNSSQNLDYTIPVNGLELGDPDLNIKALARGFNVRPELINDAYQTAMNNSWSLPVIPVELTVGGPYQQILRDKFRNFIALAVTSRPAEFDRVWNEGFTDWMDSGARAVIEERAAKYIEP